MKRIADFRVFDNLVVWVGEQPSIKFDHNDPSGIVLRHPQGCEHVAETGKLERTGDMNTLILKQINRIHRRGARGGVRYLSIDPLHIIA